MTGPDWAQKKVDAMMERWTHGKQEEGWSKPLARLLRAERRRAVRVCKRKDSTAVLDKRLRNSMEVAAYVAACDDCAQAIAGGK